jgi:hypothetical protein
MLKASEKGLSFLLPDSGQHVRRAVFILAAFRKATVDPASIT